MGHALLATTERYLHARPATELADKFTQALQGGPATSEHKGSPGMNWRAQGKRRGRSTFDRCQNERSPRGIAAEAGELYRGHTNSG
jgi:hypothetical protein